MKVISIVVNRRGSFQEEAYFGAKFYSYATVNKKNVPDFWVSVNIAIYYVLKVRKQI